MEFKVFYWEKNDGPTTYYDASNKTKTALPDSFAVPTQNVSNYHNDDYTKGIVICNIDSLPAISGYTYDSKIEYSSFIDFESVKRLYYNLRHRVWLVQPQESDHANSLYLYYKKPDPATLRHILHRQQAEEGIAAINEAREILKIAMQCFDGIINT